MVCHPLSHETILTIIYDHLEKKKVSTRRVPKILTEDHKIKIELLRFSEALGMIFTQNWGQKNVDNFKLPKFYTNYERILNSENSEKFGIFMLKKKKNLEFLQKMCMSFEDILWNFWKILKKFKGKFEEIYSETLCSEKFFKYW